MIGPQQLETLAYAGVSLFRAGGLYVTGRQDETQQRIMQQLGLNQV